MLTIYHHDDCLEHDPGPHHPENAGRLASGMAALRAASFHQQSHWAEAPLGTEEQVLLAHAPELWRLVNHASPKSGRVSLDPDTHMSPVSLSAALRGVGAACAGVDALMQQRGHVFCLTRPPGHHATPDHSMGFCFFNQIAIAALYAQKHYGLTRVAVVDFDVHHGNGTQDIFEGRENLLYISTHQFPHYPGTGSRQENIAGNIHNVPLRQGTNHDGYVRAFEEEVLPQLDAFRPDLLLVSAGFDAHEQDPLAGLALTEKTYRYLGQQLKIVAERHSGGRLLSVLEGGYNLDVLGTSIAAYCEGTL